MKHTFWNMIAAIKNGQMAHKLYVLQSKKKKLRGIIKHIVGRGIHFGIQNIRHGF